MTWNSIGVPNIPGIPENIGDAVIKFGGSQLINAFFGDYWGIFDQNGIPLLLADKKMIMVLMPYIILNILKNYLLFNRNGEKTVLVNQIKEIY